MSEPRSKLFDSFNKAAKLGSGVEEKASPTPNWKALVELAARVLLQHMNDEDYEMSLAGLYAALTEHTLDEPGAPSPVEGQAAAPIVPNLQDIICCKRAEAAESKLSGVEGLVTALTSLRNEVTGILGCAMTPILLAIGFTNVQVLKRKLDEAERALLEWQKGK